MKKFNWEIEDMEFSPKRKVNNKGSWNRAHIIGTFYSNKMNKEVEYESLNEFIFCALLELDIKTIRYYVQPVEINVSYIDKDFNRKSWIHIPDVIVFREDMIPTIYQVKDIKGIESEKLKITNKVCYKYVKERKWDYKVIYPKTLDENYIYNIKFLFGFLKERKNYDKWVPKVIKKVTDLKIISISQLAKSFSEESDPLIILPVIYHLIAVGVFSIELNIKINESSKIKLSNIEMEDIFLDLYEGINYENK